MKLLLISLILLSLLSIVTLAEFELIDSYANNGDNGGSNLLTSPFCQSVVIPSGKTYGNYRFTMYYHGFTEASNEIYVELWDADNKTYSWTRNANLANSSFNTSKIQTGGTVGTNDNNWTFTNSYTLQENTIYYFCPRSTTSTSSDVLVELGATSSTGGEVAYLLRTPATNDWGGGDTMQFFLFGESTDDTPPTNSTFNYTNPNMKSGENSSTWNGGGIINITSNNASFTFTTNENSNCSVALDQDLNFSAMVALNSSYQLSTTDTTSHSMTAPVDNITTGDHCFYVACEDSVGNDRPNSTSGCLNIVFPMVDDAPNVTLESPANATSYVYTSVTLNCSATDDYNLTNISLMLSDNNSLNFARNITDNISGTATSYSSSFDLTNLLDGTYLWNCEACDNSSQCNQSIVNRTFIVEKNTTCVTTALLTPIFAWTVNFTLGEHTNTTGVEWYIDGNYTWNLTEYNITAYNNTKALFNLSNQCTGAFDVSLKQNQTKDYYEWNCDNGSIQNITTTAKNMYRLNVSEERLMNCTLDLNNISQTYSGWIKIADRGNWNFNYTFTIT